MPNEKPARRLGRGLDALIRGAPSRGSAPEHGAGLQSLKISSIRNNPYQPRKRFAQGELKELQESIEKNGLLQPITVRKAAGANGYELIAGERRLRASTNLGWTEIPAIVRDVDDKALLTYALIENLQRADLDPIEEAEGYQQLVHEFGMKQHEVAEMVGKDRTTVANSLRLLNLPPSVRDMVREGSLTIGHAKALLALEKHETILALAKEIVARHLTVRDVERRIKTKRSMKSGPEHGRSVSARAVTAQLKAAESLIRKRLQTDIELVRKDDGAGVISIRFYSDEDFERVLDLMGITLQ